VAWIKARGAVSQGQGDLPKTCVYRTPAFIVAYSYIPRINKENLSG
jgi:hypothetical protein